MESLPQSGFHFRQGCLASSRYFRWTQHLRAGRGAGSGFSLRGYRPPRLMAPTMTHFPILNLPTFKDARGSLTVLEAALPFTAVRTYWIYGADGQTRG